ncbi:MAG: T9SS type A sorting domain-containing protein, partial [Bacteroidia bacterium]
GTLKTPNGEFNTLRLRRSSITDFSFEGGLPNPLMPSRMIWTEIPLSSLPITVPNNQLDVRYIWLSENSKYFLAEARMVVDTPDQQKEFRYQTPRPVSSGLLNSLSNKIQTTAFPNPANEVLNIEAMLAAQQNYTVTLTDITGKVLNSFNIVGNHQTKITLPTANLRDGLYFVRIAGSDGQAIVKFSVNR